MTISALAALALACGGGCTKKSDAPAPAPTDDKAVKPGQNDKPGPTDKKRGPDMEREAGMPAEVAKFHDLIKPLWHADLGDKRTADTCAALPAIQAQADAVAKAPAPPAADATKWAAATKELVDAAAAMKDPCDKKDTAAFEPAFKRVHEGFHGLLAASGTPHDEKGEHHE